ncbi:MAG: hypothetical protein H0T76_18585 [Nannocystis sp.]|nr:hypothetical protein [Nannocystis sp.]
MPPTLHCGSGLPRLAGATSHGWAASLAMALICGCAGKNTAPTGKTLDDEPGAGIAMRVEPAGPVRKVALIPLQVDTQHCDSAGKRVLQQDLDQNGRADLITLTLGGENDGKIRCQQADLNRDGRLDAFLHYDERGDLVREQFDQDFDGRIDLGRSYKDGVLELDEQDLDHDGFVDAWRRYDKGKLVRIDHDRDIDGRADTFTFYVRGQIDRVGYDTNGDGNVDVWDQDVARRAQAALALRMQARNAVGDEFVEPPQPPPPEAKVEAKPDPKADPKSKAKDAGKAKDAKPESAKPEVVKPESAKPEVSKDPKSKSGQPEPGKPKDAKPATEKPPAAKPEAVKPPKSEAAQPSKPAEKPPAGKPDAPGG